MKDTGRYAPEATRREVLEAAFEEIWRYGFRSASLDRILAGTGVTKGALYHHFRNKAELGYAVVEEVVKGRMEEQWIGPLGGGGNPIDWLRGIRERMSPEDLDGLCRHGSPLHNLAQEMSPLDEGFRTRVNQVYREWRDAMGGALRRGQQAGTVRANIDPDGAALFVIAVYEGAVGMAKAERSPAVLAPCLEGLAHYLEALRPRRTFRSL